MLYDIRYMPHLAHFMDDLLNWPLLNISAYIEEYLCYGENTLLRYEICQISLRSDVFS